MKFKNYLMKGFRTLSDFAKHVKELSEAALMRLFNKRRKHYDQLIKSMDSFSEVVEATAAGGVGPVTEIDITNQPKTRKTGGGGTGTTSVKSIRSNTALPIKSFKSPNKTQIAKDSKILDEAEAALEEIEIMRSAIPSSPKTVASKKFIKELDEYKETLEEKVNEVYNTLVDIASKHEPDLLNKLRKSLQRFLDKTIPAETYGGGLDEPYLYITSNDSIVSKKNAAIEFTYYLFLDDLDKDIYKNGDLVIVLTGIVKGIKDGVDRPQRYHMETYLTSLNEYQAPGSFKVGKQIKGSNFNAIKSALMKEATNLVAINTIKPIIGKVSIDLTQQKLRNSPILDIAHVVDADVVDGDVVIHLDKDTTDRMINTLLKKLIPNLKRLARMPKRAGFVSTDLKTDVNGDKYITMTKVKNMAEQI